MQARLCSNLFAWDGHGLKAYLLAPVPRACILVGKGFAYGLLAIVQFGLAFATLGFAYGRPTIDGFLGASPWYLSALLVVIAAGTVFSVLLTQAESLQKFQRREQAIVGLLCFPLLGAAMAPGLGAMILAGATGRPWLLPAAMGGVRAARRVLRRGHLVALARAVAEGARPAGEDHGADRVARLRSAPTRR